MAEMQITQWAGSEITGDMYETPEEGPAYCLITSAEYDEEDLSRPYKICLYNLNTGKDIRPMVYKRMRANENNVPSPNRYADATLVSLGYAIFGQHVGVPFYTDIIGAVVTADFKLREYNGKTYANVYKYSPAPAEVVRQFGSIVQSTSDEGVVEPDSIAGAPAEAE